MGSMRGGWVLLAGAMMVGGCQQVIGWKEARRGWRGDGGGGAGGDMITTSGSGGHASGGGGVAGHGGALACDPGSSMPCYSGPAGTEGKGICKAGTMACKPDGSGYGACTGDVVPQAETCASADDEDCSGHDCVGWAQIFGDSSAQFAYGVGVDGQGNTYVAGSFSGALAFPGHTLIESGFDAMFVVKFDPTGKHVWSKQYSGAMTQSVLSMAVDTSGNVVVGGYSVGAISFGGPMVPAGAFITKLDTSGTHVWSKSFGGGTCGLPFVTSAVGAVGIDPNGDVVAGGAFCGSVDFGSGAVGSMGNADGFVVKLRGSDGSAKTADGGWFTVFGDNLAQAVSALAVDPIGNILIAGTFFGSLTLGANTLTSEGSTDVFLAKLKPSGAVSWVEAFHGPGAEFASSLTVDPAGSPILAGTFGDSVNFGGGAITASGATSNLFVVKYSAGNVHAWSKGFSGDALLNGIHLASDAGGNVFLAAGFLGAMSFGGDSLSSVGAADILLAKLDASGAPLWHRTFGDDKAQLPGGVAVTPSGEPILAGSISGAADFGAGMLESSGQSDLLVAKFAP